LQIVDVDTWKQMSTK